MSKTESFDLELGFSKSKDQVKVTFEYPEGRAISAIYAIDKLRDYIPSLLETLAEDPSVEAALAVRRSGVRGGAGRR